MEAMDERGVPTSLRVCPLRVRLAMCCLAARGLWAELAPLLRRAEGQRLRLTRKQMARLVGAEADELSTLVSELARACIVEVQETEEEMVLAAAACASEPSRASPDREEKLASKRLRQRRYRQRKRGSGESGDSAALSTPRCESVRASATGGAPRVAPRANAHDGEPTLPAKKKQEDLNGKRDSSCSSDPTGGILRHPAPRVTWDERTGWGPIPPAIREGWKRAYPNCDHESELDRANSWMLCHPEKWQPGCKAPFLDAWMSNSERKPDVARATKVRSPGLADGGHAAEGSQRGKSRAGGEPAEWDQLPTERIGCIASGAHSRPDQPPCPNPAQVHAGSASIGSSVVGSGSKGA